MQLTANRHRSKIRTHDSEVEKMKVLVACEFSGTVRDAFIAQGHDAWSCDILPSNSKPERHITGNVLEVLDADWDLIIAHPPCTYLCNSGVRWLYEKGTKVFNPDRYTRMTDASCFFHQLLSAPCDKICVENPVPHKHANLPPYTQTIQPWQFGHPESKRTCLWLKGLPNLIPTLIVEKTSSHWDNQTPSGQNKLGPSADRWKQRSITYRGIASAMATQWG